MLAWVACLALGSPVADDAEVAVRLIRDLALDNRGATPVAMLRGALMALSGAVPWLFIDDAPDERFVLRHGDGRLLLTVGANDLPSLVEAVAQVDETVRRAGPIDVDVGLVLLDGLTVPIDPWSRVLAGDELARFDTRLRGVTVDVGVLVTTDADGAVITRVAADGPASRAGVLVGDRLASIDGRSTAGMREDEVIRRMTGVEGTRVALGLVGAAGPKTIALRRASVAVPNVRSAALGDGIGYVQIDAIHQVTVANVATALDALAASGAASRGLILDVRGNAGGAMRESARVADRFVTNGLLLRTEGRNGTRVENLQAEIVAMADGDEPAVPLVVLVDEATASGGEIVAGALAALDRAVLVGAPTYGKGTVQKTWPLADPARRLKLTVARYTLAGGRSIPSTGWVPDAVLWREHVGADHWGRSGLAPDAVALPSAEGVGFLDDGRDVPLELARRALLNAPPAAGRAEMLPRLRNALAAVRAEEAARLDAAWRARGLDPQRADEEGGFTRASVDLVVLRDPEHPERLRWRARVRSPEELHRAVVELSGEPPFRGVHIPVGRVAPGGFTVGEAVVHLPPGRGHRLDRVEARLVADMRAPLPLDPVMVDSGSEAVPTVEVAARIAPLGAGRYRIEAGVVAPGATLVDLGLHVGWPEDVPWIVAGASDARITVTPGMTGHFRWDVQGGPAPEVVPLTIVIDAPRFGEIVRWNLSLSTDGSPVLASAPRVEVATSPLVRPGPVAWRVRVQDDRAISDVVVRLDGEKIAWAGGPGDRLDLPLTRTLAPGLHHIEVVARDDQGLASHREAWVLADEPAVAGR